MHKLLLFCMVFIASQCTAMEYDARIAWKNLMATQVEFQQFKKAYFEDLNFKDFLEKLQNKQYRNTIFFRSIQKNLFKRIAKLALLEGLDHTILREALMNAILNQNIILVQFLLENGVSANTVYHYTGEPVLFVACHLLPSENALKIIELLLQHGAYINARDKVGRTVFDIYTNWDTKQFLLSHGAVTGADIAALKLDMQKQPYDFQEMEFYIWAENSEYASLSYKVFLEQLHNKTLSNKVLARTVRLYVKDRFVDIARRSLVAGADPNYRHSLLQTAIWGHVEIARLLLQYGARMNEQASDTGSTALHVAVRNKHLELVQVLLEHGADINMRDYRGNTPLDLDSSRMIKELLRSKGAVHAKAEVICAQKQTA